MDYNTDNTVNSQYGVQAPAPVGSGTAPAATPADAQAACDLAYLNELITMLTQNPDPTTAAQLEAEISRVTQQLKSLQGQVTDPQISALLTQANALLNGSGGVLAFTVWWNAGSSSPNAADLTWINSGVYNFDPSVTSPDTYFAYIMVAASEDNAAGGGNWDWSLRQVDSQGTAGYQYVSMFLSAYLDKNTDIPPSMVGFILGTESSNGAATPGLADLYTDFTSGPDGYQQWQVPAGFTLDEMISAYMVAIQSMTGLIPQVQ